MIKRADFPGQPEERLPIDQLPGEREVRVAEFDPERKYAFGSVPRLLDISVDNDIWLKPEDVKHASPDFLAENLRQRMGKQEIDGVPFNEFEYSTAVTHVPTLIGRTAAKALKPYALANTTIRREVELKAHRGVLEGVLPKHKSLFEGLQAEVATLRRLRYLADKPGFALEKGGHIKELAALGWASFDNMLRVVGDREKWDDEKRYRVNQALLTKLSTGPQREKIGTWQAMTGEAYRYAVRRFSKVGMREKVIEKTLSDTKGELDKLYSETGFFEI